MCSEGASLGLRFHPRGNPYWVPWLPNPRQPVEMKDVFPAAPDQTPAPVLARLARGSEHPVLTRISAEIGTVSLSALLCANCHRLVHRAISREKRWLTLEECKATLGVV